MKRKFLLLALALIFVSSVSAELVQDTIALINPIYKDSLEDYEIDEDNYLTYFKEILSTEGNVVRASAFNPTTGQLRVDRTSTDYGSDNFTVTTWDSNFPGLITQIEMLILRSDSIKPDEVQLGFAEENCCFIPEMFNYDIVPTITRNAITWKFNQQNKIRNFYLQFPRPEVKNNKTIIVSGIVVNYITENDTSVSRPRPINPPCLDCDTVPPCDTCDVDHPRPPIPGPCVNCPPHHPTPPRPCVDCDTIPEEVIGDPPCIDCPEQSGQQKQKKPEPPKNPPCDTCYTPPVDSIPVDSISKDTIPRDTIVPKDTIPRDTVIMPKDTMPQDTVPTDSIVGLVLPPMADNTCAICGYVMGPAYMKSLLEPLTKQELAYVNQKFGEEVANFCDIWSTNIPAIKKNERKECLDVLRGMTYCDYLEYSHSWWEVLAMNAAFSSMQKSEAEGVAKLLPKTDPPVLLVLKEKFLELYKPSEPADKVVEQLVMYHFTLKFSKVLHQYDLEKYVYDVYEDD